MTLSPVASPTRTQSFEENSFDVRLHAPTTDTVIVWATGPIQRAADAVPAVLAAGSAGATWVAALPSPMEGAQ